MQFAITLSTIGLTLTTSALADPLRYDNTYDNSNGDLATVACSNGQNGLLTWGFTTFGSLPSFPNVGSSSTIPGWNSPNCGSCFNLTYEPSGNSINFLAIDHAAEGFVASQAAVDDLTNGHAVEFGTVDVTAQQVDDSVCGL